VQLIVVERDEEDLTADIEAALEVRDRWERRRALRKLAGRIARVTVSVWVRRGWHPTEIANPLGRYDSSKPLEHPWWIVHSGNYDPETGLKTEGALSMSTQVTGTLVWYYAICPREAWLMAHEIEPEKDFDLLAEDG
jgi:hypothetical protein